MASSICWRCLTDASSQHTLRQAARHPPRTVYVPTLSFSTSPAPHGKPPNLKNTTSGAKVPPKKGAKTLIIGKKKVTPENRARRPAPGERKALRKRIVLSNVNALEVPGMQDISENNMFDGRLESQVLGFSGQLVDQLRAVEAFKSSQGWGLFRRPGTLMRRETLDMGKMIADMSSGDGPRKTVRRIVVGERGSGKSMMLLQAMTMAMLKGWTVINLPEAQDITIGHTPYQPLPASTPTQYIQPAYLSRLLRQIPTANPHLATLQLSQSTSQSTIPIPIAPNMSLARLASLGASDPDLAHPIFTVLITELLAPGRPPLFLGLDGLAHAMQPATGYTAPNMKPIHPHDLMILNWYLSFLCGGSSAAALPNGGIVMAATSQSNAPQIPALDLALSQLEGARTTRAGQTVARKERVPFMRYDERVLDALLKDGAGGGKIGVQRLQGLSKEEARGLLEYWARSGMVRERVSEGFVGEKWAVSGGGVVGELARAVVEMRV
ncbi:MAG: hypothetical protein LQ345_003574 [Seirophora villosa]|nr:MAG: hypothetical protein LQ345_003574 [Seirophora villosa]